MAIYNRFQIPVGVEAQTGDSTRTSRSATGSEPIGQSSNFGRFGDLQTRITNSPAYQQAYQLFSQESEKMWLQQLEAIPFSYADANRSPLDDMGLSTRYEDSQDASYNAAMQAISNLLLQYRTWKNSLPITQSQQFADAGINSAITGQGINGSDIPNVGSSVVAPPAQDSTVQFLSSAATFILDSVTGLASVSKAFKDLGYQQDTQFFDLLKYLREEGISFNFDNGFPRTLSEFFDRTLNPNISDAYVFKDPKGARISSEQVIESILHSETFAPLYKRWQDEISDDFSHPALTYLSGVWSSSYPIGVQSVTEAQYDSYMTGFERKLLQDKLSIVQMDNSISLQDKDIQTKSLQNQIFDLQLKEAKIKFDLINKLKDSPHIDDRLLLSKVLLGYNYDDIDILHNEAGFIEAEKSLGMFGTFVKMLNGNGNGGKK